MGNHRFKLSDMMPNAWFYKLRDMSKVRSHNPSHPIKKNMQSSTPNPRKSFYYTTDPIRMDNKLCISPQNPKIFDSRFPHDPSRKSTKKRSKRKTIYMPSPRKVAPSEAEIPTWLKPNNIRDYFESSTPADDPTSPDIADSPESPVSGFDYENSFDGLEQSNMSSCSCKLSSSATDIIINVDETSYDAVNVDVDVDMLTEFDMISEPDLPPIQTKPGKHVLVSLEESVVSNNTSIKFSVEKPKRDRKNSTSPGGRKSFSGGVKLRANGRKPGGTKSEVRRRRKIVKVEKKGVFYSESFAIVKASIDPEKDFRESMMEMIVENNIKASKDLEELLACYLSLNSTQYHDLIIKAFEQIWFTMNQLHV